MGRADRRAWSWVAVVIVIVALSTRLGPDLVADGLRQPADDDAGVYFGAAQHLVAGRVPYRDFLFIQPPGIVLLLAPFAALSFVISDATAFECVRIASALVGTLNALLVARLLLGRYGLVAASCGGLLYAAWSATAASESSALLEPLLNLALLATLLLLRGERSRRALVLIGLLLGAAIAVKIWAVADVVVLLPVLWVRRGSRAALSWLAGVVLAAAVLVGPFLVAAPAEVWRSIVTYQLGRGYDGRTLPERLTFFLGRFRTLPGTGAELVVAALFGLVIVGAVVAVLGRALRRRELGDPGLWAVLLAAHLALLAASPSFYYHYAAFAAAPLCLLVGCAVGRAHARFHRRARSAAILAAAALVVGLGVATVTTVHRRTVRYPQLIAFAAQHRCVWSDTWMLLVSNDIAAEMVDAGCPTWVDRFAHTIVAADGTNPTAPVVRDLAGYQHSLRRQFAASDAMIVSRKGIWYFSPATKAWVHQHFTVVERVGDYVLFAPRG